MTDATSSIDPHEPPQLEPDEPRGRRKLTFVIAGLVAALVAVGAGGAFALVKLSGGGPQPHDVLPDTTTAYVRVDLDPSASQKINLIRLLRRVPEFSKAMGISSNKDDVRKALVASLFGDRCIKDYDKEVEPWIGERAGLGYGPGAISQGVLVLGVSDEDQAKKGLVKLLACFAVDDYDVAFSDGYALITSEKGTASAIAAAGKEAPLASLPLFTKDMDDLGEQGVASAWVNVPALIKDLGDDLGASATELGGLEKLKSVSTALRAGSSTIELVGNVHQDGEITTEPATDLGRLPADTLFAIGGSGGGAQVEESWPQLLDQLTAEGLDPQSFIDEATAETGLVLPTDLATLLGDSLTLAIGSRGLETLPSFGGPSDLGQLDIGLLMSTDPTKAKDLVARLSQSLLAQAGITLATADTTDGLAVATNQSYADALAGDNDLRDEDAFSKAFDAPQKTLGAMFLNVDRLTKALRDADAGEEAAEVVKQLDPVQSVGFWTGPEGNDLSTFVLRVAFD
ncbi:hypothetical protein BH09ACT10_BH09ACT10_14320 [soil metagenome]